MAFMAALEADLRALSAEARRRHPSVKDAAEHAILKPGEFSPMVSEVWAPAPAPLRSLSSPMEIAQNEDILRMFLVACSVKSVKLSVIGLSCLQKLISHDAVASSALKDILTTLKDHAEMTDEIVQLKTLQTILIIFQSHLQPESELPLDQSEASPVIKKAPRLLAIIKQLVTAVNMSQAFDICLHLLESNRSSDSVRKNPTNTNVVENIVRALALVVATIQASDLSEETLAAVAGMFSSKAKGIEWSMDNDASNAAVLVASEAHTITLALEGLLGVVFTIATLTDEALDVGELESPKCELGSTECCGQLALLCAAMNPIDRSQGEAIILEILKGYQAFTQACGVLRAIEPLNSFLASLCKFTINNPNEGEKRSLEIKNLLRGYKWQNIVLSPGSKKVEMLVDQRDSIILTPKNVQALRTLFNVAHRLHNVLGPSWVLVLETLAALDRAIHSPHASTQEVSASVSRLSRDTSGQYSDFHILSSLNSQALLPGINTFQPFTGVEPIWDQIAAHHLEVKLHLSRLTVSADVLFNALTILVMSIPQLANCSNAQLRNMALESLDHSICSVVGSEKFQGISSAPHHFQEEKLLKESETVSFEYAVLSPLVILYSSNKNIDVQMGALKILLHVLESSLMLSLVNACRCILVTGAYGTQKTDINISLTAVGLLWTATDFVVKGLISKSAEKANGMDEEAESGGTVKEEALSSSEKDIKQSPLKSVVDYNKLFFSVFSVLQKLGADDRPETLSTHGQKLSKTMWEDCLWIYVFPMLERVSHLASTSSRDEWQGKELGTRAGKAVHMLIHHSRNTAQKQWDETIVLVLGGIARLLRSFFPFLQQLSKFSSGWVLLLDFVKNGILNGSKEVALAAINCLQTFVGSNCSKGNLESSYVKSVLDIYELVLQTSPNYKNDSADKVKQEVLRGLGDLYVQAQSLFNDEMYLRLMAVMHLMIKSSMNPTDYDNELGSIPALQRGILEIIPMLRPTTMLSSMWSPLLLELLCYLNSHDTPLQKQGKEMHEQKSDAANGATHGFLERSHLNNSSTKMDNAVGCGWGIMFIEKLVPIVVNLFLEAPQNERFNSSPEVIRCLGRTSEQECIIIHTWKECSCIGIDSDRKLIAGC
ncbi:SF21-like protein [Oryza sativa Japonica Group]|uniref:SF21-like protein n=1 Tax=Oryza sativa subsp. japonica TaxID=39947 RepID=Q5N8Y4_ORYSJ|nr:SF21-like protein [Oryza sativa Japonica Group]